MLVRSILCEIWFEIRKNFRLMKYFSLDLLVYGFIMAFAFGSDIILIPCHVLID